MIEEMLYHRGTTVVQRLALASGEATWWYCDPFYHVSVVFKGDALTIEFRDGNASKPVKVTPRAGRLGRTKFRIHRAVNTADGPYEEITVFFLAHPEDAPQPDASVGAPIHETPGRLTHHLEVGSRSDWVAGASHGQDLDARSLRRNVSRFGEFIHTYGALALCDPRQSGVHNTFGIGS